MTRFAIAAAAAFVTTPVFAASVSIDDAGVKTTLAGDFEVSPAMVGAQSVQPTLEVTSMACRPDFGAPAAGDASDDWVTLRCALPEGKVSPQHGPSFYVERGDMVVHVNLDTPAESVVAYDIERGSFSRIIANAVDLDWGMDWGDFAGEIVESASGTSYDVQVHKLPNDDVGSPLAWRSIELTRRSATDAMNAQVSMGVEL